MIHVIALALARPDRLPIAQIDSALGVLPGGRGERAGLNPSSSRDIPPGPFVPVPLEVVDQAFHEPRGGRNALWVARAWQRALAEHPDDARSWTIDPDGWADLGEIDRLLAGRGLSNVARHSPDDPRVAYCIFVDIDAIDVFDDDTDAVAVTNVTLVPAVIMTLVQIPDETWRIYSVGPEYGKPQVDRP